MRFLLFADLHLDTPFRWARPEVAARRRQSLRDTFADIVRLAGELEVDALCCAGDLYEHDRVAPDTAAFLRQQLEQLGPTRVFFAPGNHDWCGPESVYLRTDWSPNVHVFQEARLEAVELADGLTIWGAAHRVPANTPGFLRGFRVDRSGINIGLLHGSLSSALPFQEEGKQPHAPFEVDEIEAAGLHHVLAGHFHTPADGRWHTYPGNPEPLAFGEIGERGAVEIEVLDDGTVTRTRHRVARTAVDDIELDITGCTSRNEIRDRAKELLAPLTGIVRLTLHGEVIPTVDVHLADLDGVAGHLEALMPRLGSVHVAYDFDEIARHEQTVRGRFVKDVLDSDLDEGTRQRVLVTGLRALEGRDDLEVL